jgi:hypothetical protein
LKVLCTTLYIKHMTLFCTEHKLQHSTGFFSHIALNCTPHLLTTQISHATSHGLSGKTFNPLKQLLSLHTQMVIQVVRNVPSCQLASNYRHFIGACCHQEVLLENSNSKNDRTATSFEMVATVYETTWFHTPEDLDLHQLHCENIRAHIYTYLT